MKTRQLGKALVAMAMVLAVTGIEGTLASASTIEITGGSLDLYSSDSTRYLSEDLSDAEIECAGSDNETTFVHSATTSSYTLDVRSRVKAMVGFTTTWNTVIVTLSGSGSSHATTGVLTGTLAGTSSIHPIAGETSPCSTAFTPCIISMSGVTLIGTHTVAQASAAVSDLFHITGDNGGANGHGDFGFETSITGPATSCGTLLSVEDGGVELVSVTGHVTSL